MTKFKNKEKQKAYENFIGKNKHDFEQFSSIWKRSMKMARGLFNSSKFNKSFKNLSARAKIFAIDEINFGDISFNKIMELEEGNFGERFKKTEKQIYAMRTNEFFKQNGNMKYTDKTKPILDKKGKPKTDENGNIMYETKSLNEWFSDYQNDKIDKDKMNDIIDDFKNLNPNREEFYASNNPSDEAIQEYFY